MDAEALKALTHQVDFWLNIVVGVPIKIAIDWLQKFVVHEKLTWDSRQTALVALGLATSSAILLNVAFHAQMDWWAIGKSAAAALGIAGLTQATFGTSPGKPPDVKPETKGF